MPRGIDSNPRFHLDQHPRVVEPVRGDGTDAEGRIGIDARRVTRDEALELMVHHLCLAVSYYEATPEDEAAVAAEVTRLLAEPGRIGPELTGATAFLGALNKFYADLRRQQGD